MSLENEETPNNKISDSYATLIGSLMYLSLATRPDITYAVNRLAQFTNNPLPKHWTAIKRIFRYLKGNEKLFSHVRRIRRNIKSKFKYFLRCRLGCRR